MASIDLRHAYYSVGIAPEQQKYFRFIWNKQIYQYTCCPNGLACLPRLFTKLLKPVFAKLRSQGHTSSGFIDDSILCGDTFMLCMLNIVDTQALLTKLGFSINIGKSILLPTKKIVYLDNTINSEKMHVSLPEAKVTKVKKSVSNYIIANLLKYEKFP